MKIYTDAKAEVHVGDTVRFIRYNWLTRGRFYNKAGIVTELGFSSAGVHFPHYARGTNVIAVSGELRLVSCTHAVPEPVSPAINAQTGQAEDDDDDPEAAGPA